MYSEVGQDIFAQQNANNKSYIEIGAQDPYKLSNTYLLEKNGWKGFSIEIDSLYKDKWLSSDRSNNLLIEDALTLNYNEQINYHGLSNRIGYLSVDINPPDATFEVLKKVIQSGIRFDCITFEHDDYRYDKKFENIAKEFLLEYHYITAVNNVYTIRKARPFPGARKKILKKQHFETWFVDKSLYTGTIEYDDWRKQNII